MIFHKIPRLLGSSLCVLLLLCVPSTIGFNLNKNGGYDLLIAVQEDTESPSDPLVYLQNVQTIAQSWSISMWDITDHKFFINSIQLVVPGHWDLATQTAMTQSYKLADIRISDKFKYLRVENPNGCGLPGQFVEVPSEFFDALDGPFGTPWKALITQWARYRFGIWEEHGYPGDEVYPYFYQKSGQKVGWLVTGCSNSKLHGKYLTIDNKTCEASGQEYPGDDCRFVPDSELTEASTSLMHFHWIKSVIHFCDKTTHDREAPNRQNRLCGHRSAWEVIRESPDYHFVTETPPSDIPQLSVQILKPSLYPRLSILLDRGKTLVSSAIIQNVLGGQLGRLFVQDDDIVNDVVAQISSFPPGEDDGPTSLIKTDVQWATIEDNIPFTRALTNVTNDGPETRDFASAVQAAVDELVNKNGPAGSILIVVKTGSNKDNFGNVPFEQDLKIILQNNPRIKLYAIEIFENELSLTHHLEGLSEVSGGKHVTILSQNDIETKLAPVIDEIDQVWTTIQDPQPERNNFRGVYRGTLTPNDVNEVPILTSNLEELEFHLTMTHKIPVEQVYVRPLVAGNYKTTFQSLVSIAPEWNEEHDATRRFTYSLKTTSQIRENSKWIIHYECDPSVVSSCDGIVHVYGKINVIEEAREEEEEEEEADPEIEIVLSTSSKIVDFTNLRGFSNSPLIIFTSVHRQGQPVIELDVSVTVSKVHSNLTWILELRDDGHGNPDISVNDGVYSASFIPPMDGKYQLSAFVKNRECSVNEGQNNDPGLKLLLPDQKNIGCYPNNKNSLDTAHSACIGFKMVGTFGRIVHTSEIFQVQNSDDFKTGQPYRILDFQGSSDTISGLITFTFISPALIASEDEGARSYSIYHSENIEDLIGDVGDGAQRLGNYLASSSSGNLELIRATPSNTKLSYYAIETNYGTMRSGPSNIIALMIHPEEPTTTTTSTSIVTSGSTTPRLSTTTDKAFSSTPPDDQDDMSGSSTSTSFWKQPKVIAAVTVASITLITVLTFVLVQYFRRRFANSSTNVV